MLLISEEYRALNAASHAQYNSWGRGGVLWLEKICALLQETPDVQSVLDYGCGKGDLAKALHRDGYDARGYDPAVPGYDHLPEKADFLVCLDVLEHIEPDCLGNVLAHIRSLAPRCLLAIATRAAKHVLPDGRNAHLIVENEAWWLERIGYHFTNVTPIDSLQQREVTVFCEN